MNSKPNPAKPATGLPRPEALAEMLADPDLDSVSYVAIEKLLAATLSYLAEQPANPKPKGKE